MHDPAMHDPAMRDPYTLLHVARGAPVEEIKRAYRRLAMQWHPDRNPTREAEGRFKQIKAAYELLLDPERLAEWALKRAAAAEVETAAPATAVTELTLHLELEEAAAGCLKNLKFATDQCCTDCAGSGTIEQKTSVACSICKGVGRIRGGRGNLLNSLCVACNGRGYVRIVPCAECSGSGLVRNVRQLEVQIPAGMHPGERLRLSGRQRSKANEEPAEDLFIKLAFYPHPFFTLEGKDLLCFMPVNLFRLLHGGTIDIPTLTGMRQIMVEPYPQHGLEYTLAGFGYPGRHGRGAGCLRLTLRPVWPQKLAEAERKLLLRLEKALLTNLTEQAPELAAWEHKIRTRQSAFRE